MTVFGPGVGERNKAIDDVLLPRCVYDGRVRRAEFCHGLEYCPVLFDRFERSWLVLVICVLSNGGSRKSYCRFDAIGLALLLLSILQL